MLATLADPPLHMVNLIRRRLYGVVGASRAAVLLEAVVGVTVLVTIAGASLMGLSATLKARTILDRDAAVENIIRNQMEAVFQGSYLTSTGFYPASVNIPAGYSVTASQAAVSGDMKLQKITVTVSYGNKDLLVVETLRNND